MLMAGWRLPGTAFSDGRAGLLGGDDRLKPTINLCMDLGEVVKALRMQLEELTEGVRTISERLNAQYTDLMLHPKELEADRELIECIVFDAAHDMELLYEDTKQLVIRQGKVFDLVLQRRLKIGYAQAAKLMEKLEDDLIVSAADGAKPRQVLVTDMAELEAGGSSADDEEPDGEDELYQEARVLAVEMDRVSLTFCNANWVSATPAPRA